MSRRGGLVTLPRAIEGWTPPQHGALTDRYGRVHTYLRVSVTDRCNYRCTYCMPAAGLDWMPRDHLLTFEEITRVVSVFAAMGVRRVRLTGGEPTVRRGIIELVQQLGQLELDDLAMTTNGHLFAKHAEALTAAGLRRINMSMDSVGADQFRAITRGGDLSRVLAAIDAAIACGLTPVKINAVVVRGVNDDQVDAMVDHFAPLAGQVEVRFIEYMPFGGIDDRKRHVPATEMRDRLAQRFTLETVDASVGAGPPPTCAWPRRGSASGSSRRSPSTSARHATACACKPTVTCAPACPAKPRPACVRSCVTAPATPSSSRCFGRGSATRWQATRPTSRVTRFVPSMG